MGDEWVHNPQPEPNQPGQDDIDKRLEEIRRTVVQGANEAQQRIKRVVDKASEYWQQTRTAPEPHQASSFEEQRIRQLVNNWSLGNWRVARDLGTYMDITSVQDDEVWEVTVQTRWETRNLEMASEPYTGRAQARPQPVLPVWDYELPLVTGLKAPTTRTPLNDLDEILSCTACNSTGRLLCGTCTGRGWIVCPDCLGRTKMRCATCRGRGYIADWSQTGNKAFFQKQAENLATSVTDRVSDVFEGIRQQGVPIPNPIDNDPAAKGKTIPCPDCVNGEVDCTCGTGKRVCPTCQGAKTEFCTNCGGTGKVVRHREIVRSFDLRTQSRFVGNAAIPEQQLFKATGDLIYNAEVNEAFSAEAAPEGVPMDVWGVAVHLLKNASANQDDPGTRTSTPQANSRTTLQVLELVRIPFTKVDYRFGEQNFVLFIYDSVGQEKFYAERFPARWERIERLVRSISNDLMAPTQETAEASESGKQARGYRVPIERQPYKITEENEEDTGWNT